MNLRHEAIGHNRIMNIGEQTAMLLSYLLLTVRLLLDISGAQRPTEARGRSPLYCTRGRLPSSTAPTAGSRFPSTTPKARGRSPSNAPEARGFSGIPPSTAPSAEGYPLSTGPMAGVNSPPPPALAAASRPPHLPPN